MTPKHMWAASLAGSRLQHPTHSAMPWPDFRECAHGTPAKRGYSVCFPQLIQYSCRCLRSAWTLKAIGDCHLAPDQWTAWEWSALGTKWQSNVDTAALSRFGSLNNPGSLHSWLASGWNRNAKKRLNVNKLKFVLILNNHLMSLQGPVLNIGGIKNVAATI